jgi:hypothetical protein
MRFLTRRRIVFYLAALLLAGSLWVFRWRLATAVLHVLRPRHQKLSATQWWSKAQVAGDFRDTLRLLEDVPPADRQALLAREAELSPGRRWPFLWTLVAQGSEAAFIRLEALLNQGQPPAGSMPELDLAGLCRSRKPVTETDLRIKRSAARLYLALNPARDAQETCPASGPPDHALLDRLIARAVLGKVDPACIAWATAHLDKDPWPESERMQAHQFLALAGLRPSATMVERALFGQDAESRAYAAVALATGLVSASDRRKATSFIREKLAAGQVVEPRLAESLMHDLQPPTTTHDTTP